MHSPLLRVSCFAVLWVSSALAGFRMGCGPGSLAAGLMQTQPGGMSYAQARAAQFRTVTPLQPGVSATFSAGSTLTSAGSSSAAPVAVTSSDSSFSSVALHAPAAQQQYIPGTPSADPAFAAAAVSPTPIEIKIPLVFSNVNLEALHLTSQEVAGIDRLRTSFTKAVGQQNPNDPQYAERWADAQPTADDKLRALLGWGRFNSYLLQAMRVR
ncbi:hypothetical protein [Prosthecobacter sp.]|uniref:hypothetical protein n=1 Tax=Prosthecobacter sp. TaxID=1965333 RepID=UPI003782DF1D